VRSVAVLLLLLLLLLLLFWSFAVGVCVCSGLRCHQCSQRAAPFTESRGCHAVTAALPAAGPWPCAAAAAEQLLVSERL